MGDISVLIIEDNLLNMKLVRSLLEIANYKVLEASDAEDGIQLLGQYRPDLILMDIQLPGMDGLSATRHIKKDPALQDIPIIALTSYAMHGDEERALKAGCDGYISKPIDTKTFLASVVEYIPHNPDEE